MTRTPRGLSARHFIRALEAGIRSENKAKNTVCFFFAFTVCSSRLAWYPGLTLAVHQNEPGDTLQRL